MPPWDTYVQLYIMQEYCSSHSNAVMCHFMHACELNLSLILGVHGQLKGESGNCKTSMPGTVTGC